MCDQPGMYETSSIGAALMNQSVCAKYIMGMDVVYGRGKGKDSKVKGITCSNLGLQIMLNLL